MKSPNESLITATCPKCSRETSCVVIRRLATIEFQGKPYHAQEEFARCEECRTKFDMFGLLDPLREVYAAYRREKGFPNAETIVRLRACLSQTQEDFADLLKASVLTVKLYERGALPSDAHGEILRQLAEGHGLALP